MTERSLWLLGRNKGQCPTAEAEYWAGGYLSRSAAVCAAPAVGCSKTVRACKTQNLMIVREKRHGAAAFKGVCWMNGRVTLLGPRVCGVLLSI